MSKKTSNFIKGAAILSAAGLIVKILGAIFRIPLTRIIGTEGMGLYGLAYPIYNFLLVISSAGFPVAISKLVAEAVSNSDYKLAHRTFKLSGMLMAALGFIAMLIMLIFSGLIATLQGNIDSKPVLMAIAPSLLFVALLSAYRGYFQGLQNMVPTAVSQIVEQLIKLIAGLSFAAIMVKQSVQMGAVGALLGITLSEIIAFLYVVITYATKRGKIQADIAATPATKRISSKRILKNIVKIAIPVAIGASVLPVVSMIDQLFVINGLKSIIAEINIPGFPYTVEGIQAYVSANYDNIELTGNSLTEIAAVHPDIHEAFKTSLTTSLYGILSSICSPITGLPLVFSTAIAMSVVPAISEAHAMKSKKQMRRKAAASFRLVALIIVPCAVGIGLLAKPIISVLYNLESWRLAATAKCLTILSLTVLFLPMVNTATSILQGVGKQNVPVINLIISAVVFKIPLTVILVRIPELNILGAAISSVVVYCVAMILDMICVAKYTGIRYSVRSLLIKPIFCSAGMGICAYAVYSFLGDSHMKIGLIAAVVVGVIIYGLLLLVTKSLRKEDFRIIPKGEIIAEKLDRFLN